MSVRSRPARDLERRVGDARSSVIALAGAHGQLVRQVLAGLDAAVLREGAAAETEDQYGAAMRRHVAASLAAARPSLAGGLRSNPVRIGHQPSEDPGRRVRPARVSTRILSAGLPVGVGRAAAPNRPCPDGSGRAKRDANGIVSDPTRCL